MRKNFSQRGEKIKTHYSIDNQLFISKKLLKNCTLFSQNVLEGVFIYNKRYA